MPFFQFLPEQLQYNQIAIKLQIKTITKDKSNTCNNFDH